MKKEMIFKPTKALELLIQSPILKQLYIPDSVYIKIYPLNQIFSIFRNINTQSHSSHLNFVINPLLYKKKATVVFFFPTRSINYNFNYTHNDWPSSFLVLFLQYHGNNSDRLAMVLCSYGGCESVYMYTPMHWKKQQLTLVVQQ